MRDYRPWEEYKPIVNPDERKAAEERMGSYTSRIVDLERKMQELSEARIGLIAIRDSIKKRLLLRD